MDISYSSNLSTLFLYRGIRVEDEGGSTSIPGFVDHEPLGVFRRYRRLGVLSSLNGPLHLELVHLLGRHDGQLWALSQLLFVCAN